MRTGNLNPVRTFTAGCFLVIVAMLLFARSSSADIYKYVDKNGTVVLTNDLRKVPEQYRGQVVITREKDEGKGKSSEKSLKGEKDTREGKGKESDGFQWGKLKESLKGFTRGRMFMPLLVIILYLALFFAVRKICAALEQRTLGFILRIILTICVLIYLYKAL
jgi:hypothetical protein